MVAVNGAGGRGGTAGFRTDEDVRGGDAVFLRRAGGVGRTGGGGGDDFVRRRRGAGVGQGGGIQDDHRRDGVGDFLGGDGRPEGIGAVVIDLGQGVGRGRRVGVVDVGGIGDVDSCHHNQRHHGHRSCNGHGLHGFSS